MKRKWMLLFGLAAFCTAAFAGPLLDRIRDRIEARHSAQQLPTDTLILRDLAYGNDPAQRLDAYVPPQARNAPIILMVHGGAWKLGDKSNRAVIENKAKHWLARGFIFVSINYRMLPTADPLTQADDVARALAFVQGHAASHSGNPDDIILMGHSAGAHLVALLNADPARARAQGAHLWRGTVALDSAAMDLEPIMRTAHMRFYDEAFGSDPAYWRAASPRQILRSDAPPLLAVCSSTRPDKPCAQAHALAEKARHLGLRTEVLEQALSHEQINENLGLAGAYTDAVERFIASLAPTQ